MDVKPSPATVLESWSSISEKTVFILDRSPYFTQVSSGHSIDGDCLKDSKKVAHLYANEPAIEPFDRSLWTCTIEAMVGYSRLVWDLFTPDQRCISILTMSPNDNPLNKAAEPTQIEKICSWQDSDQNLDHLLKSLAKTSHQHQISPQKKLLKTEDIANFPNCDANSLILNSSMEQALTNLGQLTSAQIKRRQVAKTNSNLSTGANNGRVILISSFQDEASIITLINKFEEMLKRKNESLKEAVRQAAETPSGPNFNPINYCDLVIVNTFPITDNGTCSKITDSRSFRPYLHCKVYSVRSGRIIAGLLNNLCLQHHNLRSTTITGIPMKEEQNASHSSQYDVEIVHCSSIHEDILNSGSSLFKGVVEVIDRNGFPCDTLKLSWCTPRTAGVELNHCVATSRITAVDVNSRPSACLTNFLLNGRSVMLEIFKSKSNRMTTHILTSHNGELFIQSLATMQNKLNVGDPPSISDHLGGRVGDYRLVDFTAFMKQHTLTRSHIKDNPLRRTCNIIKRQTLYWPLTLGHTIMMNVPNYFGKLTQIIEKECLNTSEVEECKKIIDNLIKYEKDNLPLPSVTVVDVNKGANSKGNGTKLEQLYKLLWRELEYFLRVHSTTPRHETILNYLLQRNDKKIVSERVSRRTASKQSASPTKRPKLTIQFIPEISDTSAPIQQTAMYYKTGMSLWQTWTQIYHQIHRNKNKLPFAGRVRPQNSTQQQPT